MSYRYIGYGFIVSKNPNVNIKNSPAYKKLRAAALDDIHVDIGTSVDDDRHKLKSFIQSLRWSEPQLDNCVIVFPSIESIGNSATNAADILQVALGYGLGSIILNQPELSTHDLYNNRLIQPADYQELLERIACAAYGRHGKRAAAIDIQFRIAYWCWQNYYVSTVDAVRLSGLSQSTFYLTADRYRWSFVAHGLYQRDNENLLRDPFEKPVRGDILSERTRLAVISSVRKYGEDFSIDNLIEEYNSTPAEDPASKESQCFYPRDIYREKNKVLYGKAALATASKKFSRGPKYVERIANTIEILKDNPEVAKKVDLNLVIHGDY